MTSERSLHNVSLLEGLATTRSILRYTNEPIPEDALRDIMFAATRAPSGSNRQPFRFIVLADSEIAQQAKTLIVVSHALSTVQELCTEVLWLDHGTLVRRGKPDEIIAAYTKFLNVGDISIAMEDF